MRVDHTELGSTRSRACIGPVSKEFAVGGKESLSKDAMKVDAAAWLRKLRMWQNVSSVKSGQESSGIT